MEDTQAHEFRQRFGVVGEEWVARVSLMAGECMWAEPAEHLQWAEHQQRGIVEGDEQYEWD